MTELYKHPITPPLALIDQWWDEAKQNAKYDEPIGPLVATQAAQWGADMELEACVNWLDDTDCEDPQEASLRLRWHRRPKPPSLKEQALEALGPCPEARPLRESNPGYPPCGVIGNAGEIEHWKTIRRALEALDG